MEMPRTWKRDIAIFLASQALSLFGSSLVQYALMWTVTLKTGSGAMMTLYIVCGFVPTLVMTPFGGVLADRFSRRKLIMLSDGMIALATLALAVLFSLGLDAFWLVFLTAGVRALGAAVQQPAVGAIIPQIVPAEALTRVHGVNGSIQAAIMLASPIASGALMTLAPLQAVFFIDVGTAALAIAVLAAFLRVPPHAKAAAGSPTGYFEDLRLGFRYVKEHRYLVSFFGYFSVLIFLVTPSAFLTPLQVKRSFGPEVWRLTAIEIAFSLGMMAGGGLISAWGGFKNRIATMVLSNAVMGACAIGLGLVPAFWPYLAVMAFFGVALPFYNTPSAVLLQEHVEGDYMGRVMSIMSMLSTSIMPLGMLLFGPLAEVARIEWILMATGALMLAALLFVPLNRRLLEAGRIPAPAAGETPATCVGERNLGA
jgi:DHA3 family macrolide efflux protein-like MFS transporter